MKRMLAFAVLVLAFALTAQFAFAVTVYYQPTPYPSPNQSGTHVWGGWLNNSYNTTLVVDSKYQVGGWGDEYRTFVRFDLTGLPQNVDQAYLWLMPYSRGDGSTPISYAVCPATSGWDLSLTWNTQPSYGSCYGWYSAPVAGTWTGFWLSAAGGPDWYNQWKNGTLANNGIMLFPQATSNNFDVFYSTQYNDYVNDPYADSRRPELQLTFTPPVSVPNFKLPLPRNISWLVTTEVGGWDCLGSAQDPAHTGLNYFSVDFSWRNKDGSGNQVYGDPDNGADIPILAAADGVVASVINSTSDPNFPGNGYRVVISHDPSQNLSVGFSTRYLHLKYPPLVSPGASVTQGQTIGYMGSTGGVSTGPHVHFGIRYADDGNSTTNVMYAVVSGWLMKSFQTECLNGSYIRYYLSN